MARAFENLHVATLEILFVGINLYLLSKTKFPIIHLNWISNH